MTRTLLALAILGLSGGVAHADSYVSLGTGNASLGGDLDAGIDDSDASALRLGIGQRFGPLALEANVAGTDFGKDAAGRDVGGTTTIGVDLKYHVGLIGPLEGYGKLGLNKTWLRSSQLDHVGTGHNLGIGLQWRFRLPITSAALWADYTHHSTELVGDGQALEGSVGIAMIGASIGF
jgi:hypothetical protein